MLDPQVVTIKEKEMLHQFIHTSNKDIDERWNRIKRLYLPADVKKLQGTVKIEYSLARQGAEKLWKYLNEDEFVPSMLSVASLLAGGDFSIGVDGDFPGVFWQLCGGGIAAGPSDHDVGGSGGHCEDQGGGVLRPIS